MNPRNQIDFMLPSQATLVLRNLIPRADLTLDQCILPASPETLTLFAPHLRMELAKRGLNALQIELAFRYRETDLWDVLKELLPTCPILLNRQPVQKLHDWLVLRPNLGDSEPVLRVAPELLALLNRVEHEESRVELVAPCSLHARSEALNIVLPMQWIDPADGRQIWSPTTNMIVDCHFITRGKACEVRTERVRLPRFASYAEVENAFDSERVSIHEWIDIRNIRHEFQLNRQGQFVYDPSFKAANINCIRTTVGRVLVNSLLPDSLPFFNSSWTKTGIECVFELLAARTDQRTVLETFRQVRRLSEAIMSRTGLSLGIQDVVSKDEKVEIIRKAEANCNENRRRYERGLITRCEFSARNNLQWGLTKQHIELQCEHRHLSGNEQQVSAEGLMLTSGCLAPSDFGKVVGIIGNVSKSNGDHYQTPVKHSFGDGLSSAEYWMMATSCRRDRLLRAIEQRESCRRTTVLVRALNSIRIVCEDCNTESFVEKRNRSLTSVNLRDSVDESLDQIVGRISGETITDARSGNVVVLEGQRITREIFDRLTNLGVAQVAVRSPALCDAIGGICQKCYGADRTTGELVEIGTPVGLLAAYSIDRRKSVLWRWGWSGQSFDDNIQRSDQHGVVRFSKLVTGSQFNGEVLVMGCDGELIVTNDRGNTETVYPVPKGAKLLVSDGAHIHKNALLFEKRSFATLFAEVAGYARWQELIHQETANIDADDVTRTQILPYRWPQRPHVAVIDEDGVVRARYYLPEHAVIKVQDGARVSFGTIIATTREPSRNPPWNDWFGPEAIDFLISGKLCSVPGRIVPISGRIVAINKEKSGKFSLIEIEGNSEEYEIVPVPVEKPVHVQVGDRVRYGDRLCSGILSPHDILRVIGVQACVEHLVSECYRGLKHRHDDSAFDSRHLEVAIHRMLSQVQVHNPNNSKYQAGQHLARDQFREHRAQVDSGNLDRTTLPFVSFDLTPLSQFK